MKKYYFLFFAFTVLLISCSKEEPSSESDAGILKNEIISVNTPPGETGVVSILRFKDLDLEMQFFGTNDQNGNISSVTSATLTMEGSRNKDFITFDNEQRVRTYHTSKNGINNNVLYKFDYDDSFYMISEYQVNWETEETTFIKMSKVSNTPEGPIVEDWTTLKQEEVAIAMNKAAQSSNSLLSTSAKNTLQFLGGIALIGAGAVASGGLGVALLAGGAIIAYNADSGTAEAVFDFIWDSFIPSASASEIDWSEMKNETDPLSMIKEIAARNEFFNWCPCSVSYEQSNPGHLASEGSLKSEWLDTPAGAVSNVQPIPGFYYPWLCDNDTYYFTPGFTFFLKPGTSAKNNVSYNFAYSRTEQEFCGGSGGYKRLWSFSCPDSKM